MTNKINPPFPFIRSPEITRYVRDVIDTCAFRVYPDCLGGIPVTELTRLAAPDASPGDRCVYIVLSLDQTKGRLGEGVERERMKGHLGAAISRHSPAMHAGPPDGPTRMWSIPPELVDLIAGNGFRLPYVVVADGLSKADARAGEARLWDMPALRPFLINRRI
jgi:hypothetical protein